MKIKEKPETNLESGERVYFVKCGRKSHKKLKEGPILSRAEDIIYNTDMQMSHHYNIFDMETRCYTSMARSNICKYNNTHTDNILVQNFVTN